MPDNVTHFPGPKPAPLRSVRLEEVFSDMPRLPKEERVRRRQEIAQRFALLEAELKSLKHLIEMDDM